MAHNQIKALKFIDQDLAKFVDLLRRNNKGETCMTLAKNNQDIIEILTTANEKYDDSKDLAYQLLLEEEQKKEKEELAR